MEDIARNAELSKGTLYTYFSNKPSLFYAVVIKGMKLLRDSFKTAVEKEPNGLGKVKSIIQAYYDYIQVNAEYYRLNVIARTNRFTRMLESTNTNLKIDDVKEYTDLTRELLEIMIKIVTLGIKDGTLRKELDIIQTVMFLGSAIENSVQISSINRILMQMYGFTEEQYLHHSIDIILKGIAGENHN
jgi:TetR/AcrR family transcriptional regulator